MASRKALRCYLLVLHAQHMSALYQRVFVFSYLDKDIFGTFSDRVKPFDTSSPNRRRTPKPVRAGQLGRTSRHHGDRSAVWSDMWDIITLSPVRKTPAETLKRLSHLFPDHPAVYLVPLPPSLVCLQVVRLWNSRSEVSVCLLMNSRTTFHVFFFISNK